MSAKHTNARKVDGDAVDLSNLRIINDCMIFDVCTGKFHTINSSAVFIFQDLQAGISQPDLIEDYMSKFKVNQPTAKRDVELFLNDLNVIR